jgi:hypothetical protein
MTTITMTDADLASIADEIEMWPYVRAPRLFDLDYAIAASAAITGREGELDVWHEVAAWCFDIMIAHWMLTFEHQNEAYVNSVLVKLEDAKFDAGDGLRGHMARGEMPDAEDFEGALGALETIRYLQGDREAPTFEDNED